MNKLIVLGIIFLTIVSLFAASTMIAIPKNGGKRRFKRIANIEVKILNISDRWIEVEGLNRTGKVFTGGQWIYIKDNEFKIMDWSEAENLFSIGDIVKITITGIRRRNRTIPIALKISKDDFTLIRQRLLLLARGKGRRIAFKATIEYVRDEYMILSRNSGKIIAVVYGKWIKAGDGEVDWSEVKNSFRVGDTVWIYGKTVLLRKGFENINAITIPQTLIDMDTGVSLIRK